MGLNVVRTTVAATVGMVLEYAARTRSIPSGTGKLLLPLNTAVCTHLQGSTFLTISQYGGLFYMHAEREQRNNRQNPLLEYYIDIYPGRMSTERSDALNYIFVETQEGLLLIQRSYEIDISFLFCDVEYSVMANRIKSKMIVIIKSQVSIESS